MKCSICYNEKGNTAYTVREMMFGLKEPFTYFECATCGCLQISQLPEDMDKYYPKSYCSFSAIDKSIKKISWFKKLQFNYLSGYRKSILGAIASFNYKSALYDWCKLLNFKNKNSSILDVGSGSGELLKKFYQLGFSNLTGIDPFIEKDIFYNEHVRVLKKDVFEVDETYDVIMLHHSLEHMPNQADVLKRLYELLNPNGKLLIRIPIMSEPLFEKYGTHMVNLDAPRHFFVHSVKSIKTLLAETGFTVYETIFDGVLFDIIASEQYKKDISIYDERSYFVNRGKSIFTKGQIRQFKKEIKDLNAKQQGSSIALFIEKK